ncbi:M3 family oligoendopeptidase [Aggregatilineales bacterium SYSU G02658]
MSSSDWVTGAEQVVWDLSILYSGRDDPRIQADVELAQSQAQAFAERYKGKISTLSAVELAEAYRTLESIYDLVSKAMNYASLNFTTHSTDPAWGGFLQRMQEQYAAINQQLVFFELELNMLEDAQADALMNDPAMAAYRYHMESGRANKPYQLSEPEERLLIEKSVTGSSAWTRLFDQIMASMELDFMGAKTPMPRVLARLHDPERAVRKAAADAVTAGLEGRTMELTYIFNVLLADKASDDRLRGYPSWIKARNLANKARDEVVDALVQTVTSAYELVARHYRLKRALLGYDELTDYDRYAPLMLAQSSQFYTWEQARDICLNAFRSFSPRMAMIAARFFDEQWIHAPAMPGKRGGAYASYGTKSTHPWVFVNFTGTANDVRTLAHELGHGVHMYLAGQHQTLLSMYTPLTTAEMASTFAEIVVFSDLMHKESSKAAQLTMIAQKVDDNIATIFRQISMNRFEEAMHTARRAEGELTTERFSELWMQTQRAMFGDSVRLRDDYALWWSYVPHFLHTPGYVYAYAFGELLVMALYQLYQQQGADFVPRYEQLLADGNSDYPEALLAKVGVDLTDPSFWAHGLKVFEGYIAQEEALARELYPEKF